MLSREIFYCKNQFSELNYHKFTGTQALRCLQSLSIDIFRNPNKSKSTKNEAQSTRLSSHRNKFETALKFTSLKKTQPKDLLYKFLT